MNKIWVYFNFLTPIWIVLLFITQCPMRIPTWWSVQEIMEYLNFKQNNATYAKQKSFSSNNIQSMQSLIKYFDSIGIYVIPFRHNLIENRVRFSIRYYNFKISSNSDFFHLILIAFNSSTQIFMWFATKWNLINSDSIVAYYRVIKMSMQTLNCILNAHVLPVCLCHITTVCNCHCFTSCFAHFHRKSRARLVAWARFFFVSLYIRILITAFNHFGVKC